MRLFLFFLPLLVLVAGSCHRAPPQAPVISEEGPEVFVTPVTRPSKDFPDWEEQEAERTRYNTPRWILKGILWVETRSVLLPDGRVKYVDRRRGKAKERGPTQIRPLTFKDFRKRGENFADLETNTAFALEVTDRILTAYYKQTGSWEGAVAAWNAGPSNVKGGKPYQQLVYKTKDQG
jgi:hypothetical protein